MTIIEGFGFKIYRLKEVKETEEFLLYDIKKRTYVQYNNKRLFNILKKELYLKGINIKNFARDILKLDQNINEDKLLKDWIEDEYILINSLNYKPIDNIIFEEDDKIYFNIYKKSSFLRNYKKIDKPEFPNIKALILNLTNNNKDEYIYFCKWLAWQIQNPLKRLPTSIIFQGEHGTGKSIFCNIVLKAIFADNFREIGQSDINKEHNEYILGKQIIVANEVIHNDNKYLVPDKLKNFVTDEYLSINQKYKDTIYAKNYAQWIFVTNNQVPLKIERGDRRYSVFQSKKLKDNKNVIGLLDNQQEEISNFLSYLFNLDVDYEDVRHPLHNEAKEDIIKASYNSVEEMLDFMEELGGFDKLGDYFGIHPFLIPTNSGVVIISNDLYKVYNLFCLENGIKHTFGKNSFSRQIKAYGLHKGVEWINEKSMRVFYIK